MERKERCYGVCMPKNVSWRRRKKQQRRGCMLGKSFFKYRVHLSSTKTICCFKGLVFGVDCGWEGMEGGWERKGRGGEVILLASQRDEKRRIIWWRFDDIEWRNWFCLKAIRQERWKLEMGSRLFRKVLMRNCFCARTLLCRSNDWGGLRW